MVDGGVYRNDLREVKRRARNYPGNARPARQGTDEQPWADPMPETPMEGPQ